MSTNLHALIRYRTIDQCLKRKGKNFTWKELAESCGEAIYEATGIDRIPSRRTIMYDMKNMKSGSLGYEAPIDFDKQRGTYFYSDSNFSIARSPLSETDVQELNHALSIIKQFQGFEQMAELENIVTRLEDSLRMTQKEAKPIIQFDKSEGYSGEQWLHFLYRSVQNESPIILHYQPFTRNQPYRTTVSPYLIKQYNRRWFLVGWNHNKEIIQTYSLDRISKVEDALLNKFYTSPSFSPSSYFDDIIGVSIDNKKKKIRIQIEATLLQSKYIKTKPIHKSQKVVKVDDNCVIFSYELIPNFEFESLLLSFGEHVTVLKPKRLRDKINQRLENSVKKYL